MNKDKVSSQEIVEQISNRLSVSKRVADEFLKSIFVEIEESLLKGEPVKIKNFGTFKLQWIEPRKSVNVQTGEVFTIEGYNKVIFTPDAGLKEAVNEPYSHLNPVEIETQELPTLQIEKNIIQTPETLTNLYEQASEIKDILSEINALSTPKETIQTIAKEASDDKNLDVPDYDIVLIDEEEDSTSKSTDTQIEQELVKEEIVAEPEIIETIQQPEPVNEIEQTLTEEDKSDQEIEYKEETTAPVLVRPKKKGLRILIGFIIVILIIGGGIYITYISSSYMRCWVQYDLFSEANRQKLTDYTHSFIGWFDSDKKNLENDTIKKKSTNKITPADTIIKPDTNKIQEQQTNNVKTDVKVDSLQQLFDTRREYNEFLGEEKITVKNRLTNIARHYYGKKEFWVYIYEANRDNIVHPERILEGTIVKIPKVDPRLIDKKNPRCLQKAKELHDLYVGKK